MRLKSGGNVSRVSPIDGRDWRLMAQQRSSAAAQQRNKQRSGGIDYLPARPPAQWNTVKESRADTDDLIDA